MGLKVKKAGEGHTNPLAKKVTAIDDPVRLNIQIERIKRNRLKAKAALADTNIQEVLTGFIDEYLASD